MVAEPLACPRDTEGAWVEEVEIVEEVDTEREGVSEPLEQPDTRLLLE